MVWKSLRLRQDSCWILAVGVLKKRPLLVYQKRIKGSQFSKKDMLGVFQFVLPIKVYSHDLLFKRHYLTHVPWFFRLTSWLLNIHRKAQCHCVASRSELNGFLLIRSPMDGEDARKVKNHCFIYQMPGRLLQLLLTERERMKNEEKDIERLIWGLQIKKNPLALWSCSAGLIFDT